MSTHAHYAVRTKTSGNIFSPGLDAPVTIHSPGEVAYRLQDQGDRLSQVTTNQCQQEHATGRSDVSTVLRRVSRRYIRREELVVFVP